MHEISRDFYLQQLDRQTDELIKRNAHRQPMSGGLGTTYFSTVAALAIIVLVLV